MDNRRTFVRHYLEMLAAMLVGMLVLGPLWHPLFGLLGQQHLVHRPSTHLMLMATSMSIAMAAWMRHRRHGWLSIGQMCAAMYLPFVVLLGPLWAGWLSAGAASAIGHVLMLPAMAVVLLAQARTATAEPAPSGVDA